MGDVARFAYTWNVRPGESLSAHIEGASGVCGIYMLHFADGQRYIGQAVNVVGRYADHARRWSDIVAVSFCAVERGRLNAVELATIAAFESRYELRNKALTGLPHGTAVLDLVVPPAERAAWMDGREIEPHDAPRGAASAVPASAAYRMLSSREDYPEVLGIVAQFVDRAIPFPRTTEQRFWTLTAMPSTNAGKGWHRIVAVSANNLELLVLEEHRSDGVSGFINVRRMAPSWRVLVRRMSRSSITFRSPIGGEIECLFVPSLEGMRTLLDEPTVVGAARDLACALMTKGPTMFARFHSPQLAGDVFDRIAESCT